MEKTIDKRPADWYNKERKEIAELCNGSTTDSDSVCWGSNPYSAARNTSGRSLGCFYLQEETSESLVLHFHPLLQRRRSKMKTEKSCGAVVFTRENGMIQYVIIRSTEGYYGFPKGHMEHGESEKETALREIKEETGLDVLLIDGFKTADVHPFSQPGQPTALKQVIYFLAEFSRQKPSAQESEISDIQLMCYEKAIESFQFEGIKRVLHEADSFLRQHLS